jgi:DNA ligase-1
MTLEEVAAVSAAVASVAGRLQKIGYLVELLKRATPDEVDIVVAFFSGTTRQGRIGVGWSLLSEMRQVPPGDSRSLSIQEVDSVLGTCAGMSGAGAAASRAQLLNDLFRRATAPEQDFLIRLLQGELRQGALEGVLTDAVARAAGVPLALIRRAAMMAGDLAPVARAALAGGEQALARFTLKPFQPVQPMLAHSAPDVGDALATFGEASFEYKLDGARIQVHKAGDEVRAYSRTLREVTEAIPEVTALARLLPAREIILDGEAIALRPNGTPYPFQVTMRRFGRKLDIGDAMAELPMTPCFFDVLYLDGQPLIDQPLTRRVTESRATSGDGRS